MPRLACPTVLPALLGKPAVAPNLQSRNGQTTRLTGRDPASAAPWPSSGSLACRLDCVDGDEPSLRAGLCTSASRGGARQRKKERVCRLGRGHVRLARSWGRRVGCGTGPGMATRPKAANAPGNWIAETLHNESWQCPPEMSEQMNSNRPDVRGRNSTVQAPTSKRSAGSRRRGSGTRSHGAECPS